jgi:hypothetical protein
MQTMYNITLRFIMHKYIVITAFREKKQKKTNSKERLFKSIIRSQHCAVKVLK